MICVIDRIIGAVGEHVVTQHARAGGDKGVGVEEAAPGGVVITALEIIEPGFLVINITAVAQGVVLAKGVCHASGDGQDIAPGVIGVFHDLIATGVQDGNHIALNVGSIDVASAIVSQGHGFSSSVIGNVHDFGAAIKLVRDSQPAQASPVINIFVGNRTVGPVGSHAVGIVSKLPSNGVGDDRCRLRVCHIARRVGDLAAVNGTVVTADAFVDGVGLVSVGGRIVPGIGAGSAPLPLIGQIEVGAGPRLFCTMWRRTSAREWTAETVHSL